MGFVNAVVTADAEEVVVGVGCGDVDAVGWGMTAVWVGWGSREGMVGMVSCVD